MDGSYGALASLSNAKASFLGLAPKSHSLIGRRSPSSPTMQLSAQAVAAETLQPDTLQSGTSDPLLLRAVRGDRVDRPPVWIMRQAGRYMKVYQDLCEKHPTFRERSENVDLAVEISLQPWKAFRPDGVILFSDILTPLTGMNIPFDILKTKGPIIHKPIRTAADVAEVQELVPDEAVPYVGEALMALREEVGNQSAVLGFVGAPFTLASYIVEGGSSKNFTVIKRLAFEQPQVLHALLNKLAESVIIYVRYQADKGAQAVQIFDSWATHLSPTDFEIFSLPYLKQIVSAVKSTHPDLPLILYASGSGGLLERMAATGVDIVSIDFEIFSLPYLKQIVSAVKSTHPDLPLILYASGSGGLLERMAATGVDIVSIDWTVDLAEARQRIGQNLAVQGNMDPAALFGPKDFITKRVLETVAKAGSHKHIMNLGHGVLVGTPEEHVAHFFETAQSIRYPV
eukprot:TRINITY_DN11013_c0_g1_i1.p1 TRINITY_DN11013_c0_g1~~TRINITY_DN11013_c0_g1_i1.p1  ORF type:complete len:493 (+),score=99.18 TRINITY_DN11013_c0_g1_i1:113-1480(+)